MKRIISSILPIFIVLSALGGCSHEGGSESPTGKSQASQSRAATPVDLGRVTRMEMPVVVRAPGKTVSLAETKVSAPFAGTLTNLRVADGDRVRKGQLVGHLVSRESEAALAGAREMVATAKTPAQRRDAQRAMALAEGNRVATPLTAPTAGMVISHDASAGDRLPEGQAIVTIAAEGSTVFMADVAQSDAARIRDGQPATIDLPGGGRLSGTVHAVLPGANPGDLTARVRIDVSDHPTALATGLFGEASITVGRRAGAITVPDAALVRNDITGEARIALVDSEGLLHWDRVTTGITGDDRTEILAPALSPGSPVVVSGQVGLPDGSPVVPRPAGAAAAATAAVTP